MSKYMLCDRDAINDDETPVPINNRVKRAALLCKDHNFQNYVNFLVGIPKTEQAV